MVQLSRSLTSTISSTNGELEHGTIKIYEYLDIVAYDVKV